MSEGISTPKSDKRDKHANRKNNISEDSCENVRTRIRSIPKYTIHYSRLENPNKVYLDHDLNISRLYKDYYIEWCNNNNIHPVKEDKYRRIFCTEFNIGFKLPKSDTCKTCDALSLQIEENKDNEEKLRALNFELELHQCRSNASKPKEAKENPTKTSVISFDLQQALPVPNLTTGPAFYLRKIWVYNLRIHDCVSDIGYMYMWPENVAHRGSDEIASILFKHFKENEPIAEKLIVFTDNCGGQNKNWTLVYGNNLSKRKYLRK